MSLMMREEELSSIFGHALLKLFTNFIATFQWCCDDLHQAKKDYNPQELVAMATAVKYSNKLVPLLVIQHKLWLFICVQVFCSCGMLTTLMSQNSTLGWSECYQPPVYLNYLSMSMDTCFSLGYNPLPRQHLTMLPISIPVQWCWLEIVNCTCTQ